LIAYDNIRAHNKVGQWQEEDEDRFSHLDLNLIQRRKIEEISPHEILSKLESTLSQTVYSQFADKTKWIIQNIKDNQIFKAFKQLIVNAEFNPVKFVKKYNGLVQVFRRNWLLTKVEEIMETNSTPKLLKTFLKDVSKELIVQEKHRVLQLQDNLYDKVQYYLEKQPQTARSSTKTRTRNNLNSNLRILIILVDRPKTQGIIGEKIDNFFTTRIKKPKEEKIDPRFAKSELMWNSESNMQVKKKDSKPGSKSALKKSKPPLTKEFYWDDEIDKIHDICKDEGTSMIFSLTSNKNIDIKQANMTTKSTSLHITSDFAASIFGIKPNLNKPKVNKIKQKFEKFKNFIETNTQEELMSARNLVSRNDLRYPLKSPSTATLGVARPTMASKLRSNLKTAEVSSKRFKVVLPSQLKLIKQNESRNNLRKVLSLSTTIKKHMQK
jgi:hypothetical protein